MKGKEKRWKLGAMLFIVGSLISFVPAWAQTAQMPSYAVATPDFENLRIYPNPCPQNETLFLRMDNVKEKEILVVLHDLLGNEVYSKVVLSDNGTILTAIDPNNKLEPGIYIVVGSSHKKELFKQKLVVKKTA